MNKHNPQVQSYPSTLGTIVDSPASIHRPLVGRTPAPILGPRLVSIQGAAEYLGVSYWAIRGMLDNGSLKRVRLPGGKAGDVRRVLVDIEDLKRMVDAMKD